LFEGQILKEGTAEYLANDPEARKIYLGENFKLDRYE
jgi:lipopolysaccharide export system ATP-binding protein